MMLVVRRISMPLRLDAELPSEWVVTDVAAAVVVASGALAVVLVAVVVAVAVAVVAVVAKVSLAWRTLYSGNGSYRNVALLLVPSGDSTYCNVVTADEEAERGEPDEVCW
jgi:hypothetical protein